MALLIQEKQVLLKVTEDFLSQVDIVQRTNLSDNSPVTKATASQWLLGTLWNESTE